MKLAEICMKFTQSTLFQTHIYEVVQTKSNANTYDVDLIGSVVEICCKIIEAIPLETSKIGMVKDRLEVLIVNRINDPVLIVKYNR